LLKARLQGDVSIERSLSSKAYPTARSDDRRLEQGQVALHLAQRN